MEKDKSWEKKVKNIMRKMTDKDDMFKCNFFETIIIEDYFSYLPSIFWRGSGSKSEKQLLKVNKKNDKTNFLST